TRQRFCQAARYRKSFAAHCPELFWLQQNPASGPSATRHQTTIMNTGYSSAETALAGLRNGPIRFHEDRFMSTDNKTQSATVSGNRPVAHSTQKMTPSEAFVETMAANGVTHMFGIMGSAFMDAMDIFAPAGIELTPVVHEQGAAHMADGYARVSGRHGLVIGQNGPGISNCVTGIAAAYWAHSPVVIVTPQAGTGGIGLGGFQEANQLPMFQEFTKYQGHVCNPGRMAEFTAR